MSTDSPADRCIEQLLASYKKSKSPIQVDFRRMIDWVQYGERATHMIHLYPAKLLPHIPVLFASNNVLSSEGDTIFDPFCGSGTVLLETLLANKITVGSDSNPLARLISKVKTTPIEHDRLMSSYGRLIERIKKTEPESDYPDVVNIDHWFHPHVKKQLNHIRRCVEKTRSPDIKDFFLVAFSNTVKRVSLADPSVSVPVKLNEEKYEKGSDHYKKTKKLIENLKNINAYDSFYKIVESNINRMRELAHKVGLECPYPVIYKDARELSDEDNSQGDESVQLVITSPPYSGAQKYIRSSSLNLGWLGLCNSKELRNYERKNIGREHYSKSEYASLVSTGVDEADELLSEIYKTYPLRAHISANYLIEMNDAISEAYRVLKYDGYFVLVIANNRVCGREFLTQEYLIRLMESYGLSVKLCLIDDIHSRGLMTKRNKAANVISSEWIVVLKKERTNA